MVEDIEGGGLEPQAETLFSIWTICSGHFWCFLKRI